MADLTASGVSLQWTGKHGSKVSGPKVHTLNGLWALKPYYLGTWTLRVLQSKYELRRGIFGFRIFSKHSKPLNPSTEFIFVFKELLGVQGLGLWGTFHVLQDARTLNPQPLQLGASGLGLFPGTLHVLGSGLQVMSVQTRLLAS